MHSYSPGQVAGQNTGDSSSMAQNSLFRNSLFRSEPSAASFDPSPIKGFHGSQKVKVTLPKPAVAKSTLPKRMPDTGTPTRSAIVFNARADTTATSDAINLVDFDEVLSIEGPANQAESPQLKKLPQIRDYLNNTSDPNIVSSSSANPNSANPNVANPMPSESAVQDVVVVDQLRLRVLIRSARNAVGLGDLDLAIKRFEQLLAEFPDYVEAKPEYAGVLIQAGRLAQAQTQLEELVAKFPDIAEYHAMYANVMIQQGKHVDAARSLRQLVNSNQASDEMTITFARVLTWQGNLTEAQQVYQTRLMNLGSLPLETEAELASLLMEINRPGDAIRLLLRLQESDPSNPDVLAALVLANARIGQRDIIHSYLESLRQNPSLTQSTRLTLADTLYREGEHQTALLLYQDAATESPNDLVIQAKLVRTYVRLYDMPAAKATLDGLESRSSELIVRLETANYQTAVGEHASAYAIYRSLLIDHPNNTDIKKGLAALYQSIGDYRSAETILRTLVERSSKDQEAKQLLAESLLKQYRIEEASLTLEPQNNQSIPDSSVAVQIEAASAIAGILVRGKQYSTAETMCRVALSEANGVPTDIRTRVRLRTTLGFALLKQGRNSEAFDTFMELHKVPAGKSPSVRYGLHQVLLNLDRPVEAQEVLSSELNEFAPMTAERVVIAELAMADCNCKLAERVLQQGLMFDPQNVYLMILLAESRSMCNRCSGSCDDRSQYVSALTTSPLNTRAQLGLARSYSRTHNHEQSNRRYGQILTAFPQHQLARIENARLKFAWKGVDAANAAYLQAKARNRPQDFLPHSSLMDVDLGTAQIEYEQASFRTQTIEAERNAKYYKNWKPRRALSLYRSLNQLDPTNQEAKFDLGQVYATLNQTDRSIDQYNKLLQKDPCHTEARIAKRRMQLERHLQIRSSFDFEFRSGRQGLTDITTLRLQTLGIMPIGDRDRYWVGGYAHRFLRPKQGADADGDVAIFGFQAKPLDYLNVFAIAEAEQYDQGFQTRVPFRAGLRWRTPRDIHLGFAGFLENIAVNGESIRQDTYRGGLEVNAATYLTWRWDVDALYRFAGYSDSNTSHEVSVQSNYLINPGRNQWRWKSDLNLISYDEATQFNVGTDDLTGIIHPYFSPDMFTFATTGLEYRRWVSPHNFRGADEHWYSLYGGARLDSDSVGYGLATFQGHRDYCGWLSTDIKVSTIFSEVFTSVGVGGFLTIRFP